MGTKVLVAHGSTRALKKAVQELQLVGCDVIATPDGGDAFARFFEDAPSVVICSASLPSLSGINFARMVRSQSPDTQVVILSRESIYDVPNGAFVLGEPLHIDELRRILPNFFSGKDGTDGTELQTPVFVQAVLRRFERDSDMIKAFDDDGITELSEIAEHRNFDDGVRIIEQGEAGDGFYLVVEGQVRVTLAERDDSQVARIGPGGFFGEMAMLSEQARSASVWSVGHSTLLFFDKFRVLPLLDAYPRVREVLSGVALKRTEDNLWSVLFDEREVDETLAELEASLELPLPPVDESTRQARTTARVVERGETLPQNDYRPLGDAPVVPNTSRSRSDQDAGTVIPPRVPNASVEIGTEGETLGDPDISAGEARAALEQTEEEKRRRHEDVTAQFPVLPRESSDEQGHAEAEEAGEHLYDPTTANALGSEVEDGRHPLPGASRRASPRNMIPIFIGGAGIGFAIGLAGAMAVLRSVNDTEAPTRPPAVAVEHRSHDASTPDEAQGAPPPGEPDEEVAEVVKAAQSDAKTPEEDTETEEIQPADAPSEETPGVKPIPAFALNDRALTPEQDAQRKIYRKRMFSAFERESWLVAIRLGFKLRNDYRLDWEAELKLAEAQRMSGENEAAIATYRHFVNTYPTNGYADNARFQLGELYLQRGDRERAKRLFTRLAQKQGSDFGKSARARLDELN